MMVLAQEQSEVASCDFGCVLLIGSSWGESKHSCFFFPFTDVF